MKKNYSKDTFLARWMDKTLSPEEEEAFQKTPESKEYKRIIAAMAKFEKPEFQKQELFQKIKNDTSNISETKVKRLVPYWVYAVASVFVVLFGISYFWNTTTVYNTNYGEHLTVALPDGSKVFLNAKSILEFNEDNWQEDRNVHLTGEAFFEVSKGEKFTVKTNKGTVEVLGTQFNISVNNDYFEVSCHEGKVKTQTTKGIENTLTIGDGIRVINDKIETWKVVDKKPNWITGESSFNRVPLEQVITALEKQFNVVFDKKGIDLKKRFTGSFTHNDLELALKTVFVPMEIKFTFKNENKIILVKE